MRYHYVWLLWAVAFLVPWAALYLANARLRPVMWRASLGTALFGLTEPIFVPDYWSPPSLFELARRTGFDVESLLFAFAIGGIGSTLYHTLTGQHLVPAPAAERAEPLHRYHRAALLVPVVAFAALGPLPWNPIYPAVTSLALGAVASVICRPGLARRTAVGGLLFLGLYALFMLALKWSAPGYIAEVWNLPALAGGLVYGIPLEELMFGLAFGLYWTGVYEHVTWSTSAAHTPHVATAARAARKQDARPARRSAPDLRRTARGAPRRRSERPAGSPRQHSQERRA